MNLEIQRLYANMAAAREAHHAARETLHLVESDSISDHACCREASHRLEEAMSLSLQAEQAYWAAISASSRKWNVR